MWRCARVTDVQARAHDIGRRRVRFGTHFGSHFGSYDRRYAEYQTCCRRRWLDDSSSPCLVIPSPCEPSEHPQGTEQTKRHHGSQRCGCPKAGEWGKGFSRCVLPRNSLRSPSSPPSSWVLYSRAINIFDDYLSLRWNIAGFAKCATRPFSKRVARYATVSDFVLIATRNLVTCTRSRTESAHIQMLNKIR